MNPLDALPQRFPFVLVDRVVEVVPGERARGVKCVASNEPWMAGHFPGDPVLPGVLLLEALAQLGGVAARGEGGGGGLLGGVDRARFRRRVVPGDRVELTVVVRQRSAAGARVHGEAHVDGELAAEADLLLVFP